MRQLERGPVRKLQSPHLDFPIRERANGLPMIIIELPAIMRAIR